jgi:hypothetical protein
VSPFLSAAQKVLRRMRTMMPFKFFGAGFVFVTAALALGGCSKTADVHYLMTIEVEDNGTVYSGSGI